MKPTISATEISQRLSITNRTIERDMAKIKELGLIEREGGDHGGTWKVIIKQKKGYDIQNRNYNLLKIKYVELCYFTTVVRPLNL